MNNEIKNLIEKSIELAREGVSSKEAIEVNTRIIELDKTESGAYTRLAKCYFEQGKVLMALELYKQVILDNQDETTTRIAKNFIKKFKDNKDYLNLLNSVKTYNEAITVAISMRRRNYPHFELIIEFLRKAYKYSDKTYQKIKIAAELRKLKKIDFAKKILDKLRKSNYTNTALDITYAAILRKEKEFEESEYLYTLVLEIEPNNIIAKTGLAATLKDMKRYEEAFDLCESISKTEPGNPHYLNVLYSLSLKLNEVEKAEKAYKILLKYYVSFEPLRFLNQLIKNYEDINYEDGITRMKFIKNELDNR